MIKGPQLRAFLKHSLAILKVFYITESDCGHTFYAETFPTLDDACHFLNMLESEQDLAYSFTRECAISELKQQILDFMTESEEC
jgi:hypothetical protein